MTPPRCSRSGLGVVGCDDFGVFPLRGKLLNMREASIIRTILRKLADHDGSHIKGLLINFLDHFFPSLLKTPIFLAEFVTPIVQPRELIGLTFSKKKADDRKEWLRKFTALGTYLDHDTDEISYSDFINKELILFSMPTMFARSRGL
ncbi:DNA topoisomerase [Lactarius hengduanensis]|nr:DNA topoisomerase [Lactarius hengduanensis]